MNSFYTILLLVASNVFMTLAWYGHLKMAEFSWFKTLPLIGVIAIFKWPYHANVINTFDATKSNIV